MSQKISAIVPFYNEEKTLAGVIRELIKSQQVDEVICINDGSTDKSLSVLEQFKNEVTIISYKKNYGKGHALAQGVKKSSGDIVLFIDADIVNLSEKEIEKMVMPLKNRNIRGVLGHPSARHYLAKLFLPLTGERAYYKEDLAPYLTDMTKKGYGVETFLNTLFPKEQIKIVSLKRLRLLEKREKYEVRNLITKELDAVIEITQEMMKNDQLLTRAYQHLLQLKKFKNMTTLGTKKMYTTQNKRVRKLVRLAFAEIFPR